MKAFCIVDDSAGFPTATTPAGTSFVTTEPAPIIPRVPILIPGIFLHMVAFQFLFGIRASGPQVISCMS